MVGRAAEMFRFSRILGAVERHSARGFAVICVGILGLSALAGCFTLYASENTAPSGLPPGQDQQSSIRDLIERGQFSQAEELLNQEIRDGSDLFSAYLLLAHLELRRGNTFASIRAYRQAEALQPQNGEVHRLLASNYFLLSQRVLFKGEIQKALAVDPADEQADYLAGRFSFEVEQNFAAAAQYLSKASRLNPADTKTGY